MPVGEQLALVLDHLTQRPQRQRADLARLFGDRNEVPGKDQPAHRMLPANQRLGRCDLLAADMHLGLVLKEHLALGHRPGQFAHQGKLVEGQIGARQIEHHHAIIDSRLFERRFGGFGEPDLVRFARWRSGDPEQHLELVTFSIEIDRAEECLAQAVDFGGRGLGRIALERDLDERATGGGDPDIGAEIGDAGGDVEHQLIGARTAQVPAKRSEIADLAQAEDPPVATVRPASAACAAAYGGALRQADRDLRVGAAIG